MNNKKIFVRIDFAHFLLLSYKLLKTSYKLAATFISQTRIRNFVATYTYMQIS